MKKARKATTPKPPKNPWAVRYTKRRLAEIQISRAVQVLVDHDDVVSALTLAGAAEEILGKMLAAKGEETALEVTITWDASLWVYLVKEAAKEGRTVIPPDAKELRRRNNRVRNEVKHNDQGTNASVAADYRYWAEEMLLRAISNYTRLFKKFPPKKHVWEWWDDFTR